MRACRNRLVRMLPWLALVCAAGASAALTDISTEPLETYSAPSSTDVKPNVLFVLDDSGSMNWDFMPDWACTADSIQNSSCNAVGQSASSADREYLFRSAAYNGLYYNPAIRYSPPVAASGSGVMNATTYPSQTGTSTATGADASTKPNWKAVKNDSYGVQSTTTSNLLWDPASTGSTRPSYFFTVIPGEYCTTPSLRVCSTQSSPSATYPYPATLRWCTSSALTTCKAGYDSSYAYARIPTPTLATITVNTGTGTSTVVSNITVGAVSITSGSTLASTSTTTVATRIAEQINASSAGFTAYASGNVVTIAAPYPSTTTATPVVSKSGGMSFSSSAFSRQGNSAEAAVPGAMLMTAITPTRTSYTYPNTAAKAATRSDCSGTTCSYAEEMTNFANWWTYYRTRMQLMKTASSNAFSALDKSSDVANGLSRFRVGFMTINNTTGSDFLNLGEFTGAQKGNWYAKLTAANPNGSTPLRAALAKAGRLYAGLLNGAMLNGVTVTDPLQYSCQQNYTILSTDGFWNETSGYTKLDGSTAVGNQDAGLPRPLFDGASTAVQTRTSDLQQQVTTTQWQASTSSLQARTGHLQRRTSSNSGSTWTAWADASSCTWDTSSSTRTECQYNWGAWATASSCNRSLSTGTTSGTTWNIANGSDCQYTAWTAYSNVPSCTAVARSAGPSYTVGTATQCTSTSTTSAWTNVSSCTASASIACGYSTWSSWSNVSSCTPIAKSSGPNYNVGQARECQTTVTSAGTANTLADVAAYYYGTDLRDPNASAPDRTGTCSGPTIPPNTVPNDLCANNVPAYGRDVATTQHMTTFTLGLGAQGQMVFSPTYWTDTSGDFYDIKVGTTASPAAGICSWQAVGSGACNWPVPASNSITNIDDLWHAAINGRGSYYSAGDPVGLVTGLAGTLETISLTPTAGTAAAAATSSPNMTGNDNYVYSSSYTSVQWYGEVIRQQVDASGNLTPQQWSAMRLLDCANSPWRANFAYVTGDVFQQASACYLVNSSYTSGSTWGTADAANATMIVGVSPVVRRVYTRGSNAALVPFTWASLSATQKSYFVTPNISGLSQFCASGGNCLASSLQTNTTIAAGGAAGEALVRFLAGDRTYEGSYFRQRTHVLGDVVSSEPRYYAAPAFNYVDAGYAEFKIAQAARAGTVYVGANDGMLHAFDGATGQERWAYIPQLVMPDLYKLADTNYGKPAQPHQFFIDGSPDVGDVCPNSPASTCSAGQWKTILVGRLNRGGKGYFALDVTNPDSPVSLWEFTDANLGYSYGNSIITKLKDGTWVVLITSGYNNADGIGRVYILNAMTGALIRTISTGVGSATTPSGLGGIVGHALSPLTDNTSVAVYGGDLLGNVWRFDINNDIGAPGYDAQLLATLRDAAGNLQPITAEPTVITYNNKRIVFVGTGRFLGTSDIANASTQSFYAIKDSLGSTAYGYIRDSGSGFVRQTLTAGACPSGAINPFCTAGQTVRSISNNAVDWQSSNGWYFDFITGGERVTTTPALQLSTLLFTTITPQAASANACGMETGNSASFVYAIDFLTGSAIAGSGNVGGVSLGNGLATAPTFFKLPDGAVKALVRVSVGALSGTDMGVSKVIAPPVRAALPLAARRVSWRELPSR